MIRVAVLRSQTDEHVRIEIRGHANYAPRGSDIVCAAVAALTETYLLGLQAIAAKYPDNVRIDE